MPRPKDISHADVQTAEVACPDEIQMEFVLRFSGTSKFQQSAQPGSVSIFNGISVSNWPPMGKLPSRKELRMPDRMIIS